MEQNPLANIVQKLPPLSSLRDVAAALGVTPPTVRRWVDIGQLAAVRIGNQIRITPDAVLAMIHDVPAAPHK